MIRIMIPYHLQVLARCDSEVSVKAEEPVSVLSAIRALESRFPMLKGTIIDHHTGQRRPKIRFFACAQDVSLEPLDSQLPAAIASGEEPLMIVGAISGG